MKIEVTITKYNRTAAIGWTDIAVGLTGMLAQYLMPSMPGFILCAVGLVSGGIIVTVAGPLRVTERRQVEGRPLPSSDEPSDK